MIEEPRSWRLERNGNTTFVAVCAEFACIAEAAEAAPDPYRHPAWQLVLSSDEPVVATDDRGIVTTAPGVLIAPGIMRGICYPAGYISLWIDPYRLSAAGRPRIHPLDRTQVRRLIASTGTDLEPPRLRAALNRALGATETLDLRLQRVLDLLDDGPCLEQLAADVGLSPRRLRQISTRALGGSLTTLRRWHRLREAVLQMPFYPTAEIAARTGFSDQSHLVRTAVAMGGVTPGRMSSRWSATNSTASLSIQSVR
ncbi:AraC family transcriptional regulator [Nocardia sp. NPDC050710]|uniref:helix-turn-helix domain-containing protein n=1 Tax=Nocardia sp. NPDC050710 TaxID=3157220 RepID=UPI00340A9519